MLELGLVQLQQVGPFTLVSSIKPHCAVDQICFTKEFVYLATTDCEQTPQSKAVQDRDAWHTSFRQKGSP